MTSLPTNPTPEQVATLAHENSGLPAGYVSLDTTDLIRLMQDAITLDRRQRLAHKVVSARNYIYEATMNDYWIDSIRRAERRVKDLAFEARREGWTIDDLSVWDEGSWRPVIS